MVTLLITAYAAPLLRAEDKAGDKKPEPPVVTMTAPLAVAPGVTTKLAVRGHRLDSATEVTIRIGETQIKPEVKSKGKNNPPNGIDAKDVGDTRVEIELALPADTPAGKVTVTVTTPDGTTEPHELLVVAADALVDEKESNNGFSRAQAIAPGQVVRGEIKHKDDVDVYSVEGQTGQRLAFEITSSRAGAPLDPALTLYDAAGRVLARQDDGVGATRDCVLRVTLPADGVYHLAVADTLERGSPLHVYYLSVAAE